MKGPGQIDEAPKCTAKPEQRMSNSAEDQQKYRTAPGAAPM